MPTSRDPAKRRRQLANLRNAPAAPAGNQRGRKHGAYARIAAAELEAKTRLLFDALADDAPVRARSPKNVDACRFIVEARIAAMVDRSAKSEHPRPGLALADS